MCVLVWGCVCVRWVWGCVCEWGGDVCVRWGCVCVRWGCMHAMYNGKTWVCFTLLLQQH